MRYLTAFVLALSLGTALSACDSKKGDPAACKTSAKDGDACKKCCTGAGASGHMWNGMSNECSCL
jgi:hypothetical protein